MFHFLRGRKHRLEVHMHGGGRHWGGGGRGPRMFDAGAMRYVVLHLIGERPRHGYEIIKEIEQLSGGGYAPSPGAVYPLLAMLLDIGHIESSAEGNKKLHSITPEGRAWLDENRQLVDAVLQRLSHPSEGGRGELRNVMHELKHAVIDVARSPGSEGKFGQMSAILRRALSEIEQLR